MDSLSPAHPLASQSVFLIGKYRVAIIPKSYKARTQRTAKLFIEVNDKQQSSKLLAQTRLAHLDIRVTAHRSLNSSQGVIPETDCLYEADADLLAGLKDQGVTAVRRITIRRDKEIPTKRIVLTLDRSAIPQHVNAGFIRC